MASTSACGDTDLVAEVLARHWRIREPVVQTDLGVSRITWRVGQQYWLSQSEENRTAGLIRQAQLVQRLCVFLQNEHFSISVPEIVASESGQIVVTHRGYGWSLTRHLNGFHPNSSDPGVYPVLTEGLARFHRGLRLFSEGQTANAFHGICARTRQSIERLNLATPFPFTNHPREQELLMRAGEWLLPRLTRFELLPRQLVHGDWTPRNVLFDSSDYAPCLTAVLDFEAMAFDPVHVDLANTCSTLLMWSGLDKIGERIQDVLRTYEKSGGIRLESQDVYTAMLAHWFCHYWSWRDRLEGGGFGQDVKERLCLRIESVLDYLSRPSVFSI
jgi:Ser/Thr protein kinase RdoA (MazF antagonist)